MQKHNMLWPKIQKYLDQRHWSLQKLSDESGISFSTLNKYKFSNINPTFEKVCKIADALNISLDKLREEK